jgi:hypothetical protein
VCLLSSNQVDTTEVAMFSDERKVLYADNAMDAQPILQWLRDNGIDAGLIDPDDLGGLDPALAFAHATGIVVPEGDVERAQALIAEYKSGIVQPTDELAEA